MNVFFALKGSKLIIIISHEVAEMVIKQLQTNQAICALLPLCKIVKSKLSCEHTEMTLIRMGRCQDCSESLKSTNA